MKQVTLSRERDLVRLGKKDFLVIAGGTNDIDKPSSSTSKVIAPLIHFVQKHKNTNFIIVIIPHRYELENVPNSVNVNNNIHRYNVKLRNILKSFTNVSLIEVTTNR
jgi:lysophospholipase L1-like esterase